MTLPQEIIRRKRNGQNLPGTEIAEFAAGLADGSWSEGQVASLAMAIFLNGMDRDETVALTRAMRDSGVVLDWSSLPGPATDKHSTGGVGDNVSLILAPIVAACGAYVPMISGRGLGHTGGTLDKMDSIPGYKSQPTPAEFDAAVQGAGCAIIGQTGDLAPADRRFYAVRDVTATVESIPLITASILSKKLAAGLKSLVLDVKSGNGAFMARHEEARTLATSLVQVAQSAGLKASALVTDMNEPLATAAGNAVEVENAVDFLTGKQRDSRLEQVTLALAAEMLVATGLDSSVDAAEAHARRVLDSGEAAERFGKMVAVLGGPADFIERMETSLPQAPQQLDVRADRDGFVQSVDTRGLGLVVVELGGGRRRPEDPVDHAVGLTRTLPIGHKVRQGEAIAIIRARTAGDAEKAAMAVKQAYKIGDECPQMCSPVLETIGS